MSGRRREDALDWLARRTGADGRPLLGAAQISAAERLRADYERGCWAPRLTADWARVPQKHVRAASDVSDGPPDSVRAAQGRVCEALSHAGPGLADALVAVCCHGRGLAETEAACGWPKRAGRLVLGIALDRLAAHYGMTARSESGITAWRGAKAALFAEG